MIEWGRELVKKLHAMSFSPRGLSSALQRSAIDFSTCHAVLFYRHSPHTWLAKVLSGWQYGIVVPEIRKL
ncbi:hypothetical protein VNO78_08246 [Psophocarpus tetragonolobus]|uniref:Uncharacterized protein n=1 Tax=Psophocarpus tetragonolobus TaxID=3891 RepID=A0AAN9T550_PSOTE